MTLLRDCIGLQKLELECVLKEEPTARHFAYQLRKKCYALFQAYGEDKGQKDGILGILVIYICRGKVCCEMEKDFKDDFKVVMRDLLLKY